MISTYFKFDGIESTSKGLSIVKIDTGLTSIAWVGAKDIIEEKSRYRDLASFYGVNKKPIEFRITFSLLDEKMTDDKKFDLARWLFRDVYIEFQTADNMSKRISVIATNQQEFMTADNENGYFSVDFRANSPYWYSSTYSDSFDLTENITSTIIEIYNRSNAVEIYYPEIEFKITEGTDVKFKNLNNAGVESAFTGLTLNETIYMNNTRHQIKSDLDIPRLSNFNKNWLGLTYGKNRIEVTGKCELEVRSKYPLYL